MAAMSPLGSGCITDLSISLLLDCTRPSEANLPMTAASTTPSWGPSIPSIAVLTADEHGRLVEFQHAPDGKTPHDSEGSFRLRCYLHHSQIFKLSPMFQMWLMDDTQPGVMRKMAYARTFGVRFRSEEASNSFFTAVQDWKSTGHDAANGTMESSKSLNKFDKKIEAASAKMYFHYYGQLLHQQNMLQDYIRTGTYYAAVVENQIDFQGCVVVDVGAGSGILSLFAAQAGAKHVYAIEASRMAEYAQKLIAGNPSLSSRITVIQGKVEEVELPEKADILISEPMGTLLVNERMLESYIIARDRFLVPKGKMFPALGRVHLAPFSDEYLHLEIASKALFWQQKNYYGVDLTALHNSAFQGYFTQPVVDAFDPRILLAPPVSHTLDFSTIKEEELFEIDVPFNFTIAMSTRVHGLACWFDVLFDGSTSQRWLTTAPGAPTTHWYQLRCVLSQPLYIMAGQTITGHLNLVAHSSQSYTINLTMSVKMCGMGAGQNGIIQTASGKFDLKEPFYRMSQVQAYSGSQDQQLQQMQIQQAIQPTQQQSQQTEVPNGTQQAFGISQVSLSSSALLQQQHQQPNQIQQQQQPQFYQQPSWNSQ